MHKTKDLARIAAESGKVSVHKLANRQRNKMDRKRTRRLLRRLIRDDSTLDLVSSCEEIKTAHWSCRQKNNLKSLRWWLDNHLGQPWDQVHRKLFRLLAGNKPRNQFLRENLIDQVAGYTSVEYRRYRVDEDGILCHRDDFESPDLYSRHIVKPDTWPMEQHRNRFTFFDSYTCHNIIAEWSIINVKSEPFWVRAQSWNFIQDENNELVSYPTSFVLDHQLTFEETDYLRSLTKSQYRSKFLTYMMEHRFWFNQRLEQKGLPMLTEITLIIP